MKADYDIDLPKNMGGVLQAVDDISVRFTVPMNFLETFFKKNITTPEEEERNRRSDVLVRSTGYSGPTRQLIGVLFT